MQDFAQACIGSRTAPLDGDSPVGRQLRRRLNADGDFHGLAGVQFDRPRIVAGEFDPLVKLSLFVAGILSRERYCHEAQVAEGKYEDAIETSRVASWMRANRECGSSRIVVTRSHAGQPCGTSSAGRWQRRAISIEAGADRQCSRESAASRTTTAP